MTADNRADGAPPLFPTVPTTADRDGRPPARRPRWQRTLFGSGGLALLLLVLAAALLIVFVVAGAEPSATHAGYRHVPGDAAYAVELRLDLPAGQRSELIEFLRHFPGLQSDVAVAARINELLDEAVETAFAGRADYTQDVAPWFDGWVVAGGSIDAEPAGGPGSDGYALVLLGVRDRTLAEAALVDLRPDGEWTSTDHNGTTIWTQAGDGAADLHGYAVTDDAVVIGMTEGDVALALDTGAGALPSLIDRAEFADRWRSLPAGRVATAWVTAEALAGLQSGMLGGMPPGGMPPGASLPPGMMPGGLGMGQLCADMPTPATYTAALSFREGHAVVDTLTAYADDFAGPTVGESGLDRRVPGDTFAFVEMREIGPALGDLVECLRENPLYEDQLQELEDAVGSIDDLVAWAGDSALAARYDGSRMTLGAVIEVTDQVRAAEAMGQLRAALIAFAGSAGEDEIVSEETYNDVRIVRFKLAGAVGEVPAPPAPEPSLSYAFDGDLLIIGIDDSFTRAVIDATDSTSLRASESYRRAVESAGGFNNTGVAYVDVDAVARLIDAADMPDGVPDDVRRYLDVFESITTFSTIDGPVVTGRLVLRTHP